MASETTKVEPKTEARSRGALQRWVTRGSIFHDKKTIPAGTKITPDMLPDGDFERMKGEGVIVPDLSPEE